VRRVCVAGHSPAFEMKLVRRPCAGRRMADAFQRRGEWKCQAEAHAGRRELQALRSSHPDDRKIPPFAPPRSEPERIKAEDLAPARRDHHDRRVRADRVVRTMQCKPVERPRQPATLSAAPPCPSTDRHIAHDPPKGCTDRLTSLARPGRSRRRLRAASLAGSNSFRTDVS